MTASEPGLVDLLLQACERDLGDPDYWARSDGYPDSLALCIVDLIYFTGGHYSSVLNIVRRYIDYRAEKGGTAATDCARELLANIAELGGRTRGRLGLATAGRPRRPTAPPQGRGHRRRGGSFGRPEPRDHH